MRPKKAILCALADENELSIMRLVLETRGYRVLAALTAKEAVEQFSGARVDLVVADYALPDKNGVKLVARLKQISPHIPMAVLGDLAVAAQLHRANAVFVKQALTTLDLLDRIKLMTARKRGPRKGFQRKQVLEEVPQ